MGSVVLALLVLSLWFLVLCLCGGFSCVGSVCLGLILSGVWGWVLTCCGL